MSLSSAVPAARGRYFYGDYCSGNVWSLALRDGKATGIRRHRFRVDALSSFGEDAAGELRTVEAVRVQDEMTHIAPDPDVTIEVVRNEPPK